MIRFIHTADVHFGMENYGRIDPKTGIHSRLLDFYHAFSFCVDRAITEEVDFFLFSGDAYKTANPSPTQQRLLVECFLKLYKANIPIVLIVGNHDNPLSFGKAHALALFGQLPLDGFHVIARPTSFTLKTKSGPVQIVGMPWPSRATIALQTHKLFSSASELAGYIGDAAALIIDDYAQKLDPSIPAVLTGHLTVASGIFSGSEKRALYGADPTLLSSQLAIEPFDYVALGHLHRYQNLNEQGSIPLVYSGSIERIDFGERKEEKGFCLVTIHDKQKTTHEFIKTPTRPFIQIETHLEHAQSHTEQLINEIKQHNVQNSIVKIVYHVPPDQKDRVDVAAIQRAVAHAHYLVGIFPVRAPQIRKHRIQLTVDMSLKQLLGSYFATKPALKNKQDHLVKKALELETEIQQAE